MVRMILAISTDPDLLSEITTHLEQRGEFRVYAATSDEDALSIAAGRKVDAVILDAEGLDIPLDSFTADLSAILPDARIMVLPALNGAQEIGESTGITNYVMLQRPFSEHEMDAILDEIPVRTIRPSEEDEPLFNEEEADEDFEPGDLAEYIGEVELQHLDEYLGSMPPPDPLENLEPESIEEFTQDEAPTLEPSTPMDWVPLENADAGSEPDIVNEDAEATQNLFEPELESIAPALPPLPVEPDFVEESAAVKEPEPETLAEEESSSAIEIQPGTAPLGIKSIRFEYYCVIIPGNPEQFLARDISDRLGFILPQIHVSRGWKVTSLSIRPLFMMWRISLPADACPAEAVEEIRRRTTSHLYTNFPNLLPKNDEQDFWAPGYLIFSGSQAPSNNLINEFIQRTRSRKPIQSG